MKVYKVNQVAILNKSNLSIKDDIDFINYLDTSSLTKNKISSVQLLNNNFPSRAKRKVQDQTILFSTVRPDQEHYGILENIQFDNLIVSTGFTTIDVISKEVNPKFLYYLLTQPTIIQHLQSIAENSVSAYPSIKPEEIGELKFKFPDLKYQQKIASILSAIDDKIELNNKINAELEGMAKLIYDYWFVQFDFPYDFRQGKPADETSNPKDVKPYKSSGGKMVWNKELKREVPEGWGSGTLKDVIELLYGKPLKSEGRTGKGFPVVGSGGIVGYHEESLVKGPGIVVGRKGTVGNITFLHEDFYPIDTSYYVKPKNDHQIYYFYFLLRSLGMEKMNSDSAVPGLNRERALGTKITQCDNKLIYSFNRAIEPTFSKIKVIQKQNQELSAIRDWLLPMLMNGQVIVD